MLMLPMTVPEDVTATEMFYGPMRSGVPTLFGLTGHDSAGEPVTVVVLEWPKEFRELARAKVEKKRLGEERQLARLRQDFEFGGSEDPFSDVTPGNDPPDFSCRSVTHNE